jgi:hypothetical protein
MASGIEYVCYIDETGFYLGEAKQIAEFVGLEAPSAFMTTTWVPMQPDGGLILVRTDSVRTLWRSLGSLQQQYAERFQADTLDQTLFLFMPCGAMRRYIAFDDIPWMSVRCPCGHPQHWLIHYTSDPTVMSDPP